MTSTRRRAVSLVLSAASLLWLPAGCFSDLKELQRLKTRIEKETGLNANVHAKTHNGVTTVEVFLLDPLKGEPSATKAQVEALVRAEITGNVSAIVIFARL